MLYPQLLHAAFASARDSGAGALRVHLASCDRAKADIVRSIGFRREARLSRHFKAGDDDVDLDIYVRSLR